MARSNKYQTHIEPYFEDIKEMIALGATEKDIYKKLGVSKNVWYKAKKEIMEFKELLNNKEGTKAVLDEAKEILADVPSYEMLLERLGKTALKEDATADVILKVIRQMYKEHNHYLAVEHEKIKIAWYEAETRRIQANKEVSTDKPQVVVINNGEAIQIE